MTPPIMKKLTHIRSILQVPTTQLANMSIDPKFVELTADVLEILLYNHVPPFPLLPPPPHSHPPPPSLLPVMFPLVFGPPANPGVCGGYGRGSIDVFSKVP